MSKGNQNCDQSIKNKTETQSRNQDQSRVSTQRKRIKLTNIVKKRKKRIEKLNNVYRYIYIIITTTRKEQNTNKQTKSQNCRKPK